MSAGDPLVSPMGEVEVGAAGRALGGEVDPIARNAGSDEGSRDRCRKVEGELAAWMRAKEAGVELLSDLGTDREAAGLKAGTHGGGESSRLDSVRFQEVDRTGRDSRAGAAPATMEERAARRVGRDDRDRRAVRGRHPDPWVPGRDKETVRLHGRVVWHDDSVAMHLAQEDRAALLHSGSRTKSRAILVNRLLLISHAKAEVEGGVRPAAHASQTRREAEPRRIGERARGRSPKEDFARLFLRGVHGAHIARGLFWAQALCGLAFAAGCAHAPVGESDAKARARFLETYAAVESGTRGAGTLTYRRGDVGRSGLNASWGSAAESVAAVVYAGPVRAADATILGDSIYLALRPYGVALGGRIPKEEGLGASGARFLVRPWDFGEVRSSLEHAAAEPIQDGWRLTGEFRRPEGVHRFVLELDRHSDPRLLKIQGAEGGSDQIVVRYGPARKFDRGKAPRWVEWTHENVRVRLDIEEHAPAKGAQFRHVPPPSGEWRLLSLEEPVGRDLLKRLLGTKRR